MKLWNITRSRGEYLPLQLLLVSMICFFVDWSSIDPMWWFVTFVIVVLFNVCFVEAYLHRYCTHRSYELHKPVEYILAVLSTVVPGTGSTVGWSTIHHAHHLYSDTAMDPHSSAYSSFWNLLMWKYPNTGNILSARKLLADPLHTSLHLYYVLWMAGYAGVWYLLFGFNGLLFGALLPWAIAPVMSTIQNYFLHDNLPFAYRNFCTNDHSQNSPIMHCFSFFACGLHNNHHAKPHRWDTRVKPGEIDSSAMFIRLIRKKPNEG